MSEILATLWVLFPHGPVKVNISDYHADMGPRCDEAGGLLEAPAAPVPEAPAAPVPEAPAAPVPSYAVEKVGRKFFVVDASTGARLQALPEGYGSEGEAWAAVMGLSAAS